MTVRKVKGEKEIEFVRNLTVMKGNLSRMADLLFMIVENIKRIDHITPSLREKYSHSLFMLKSPAWWTSVRG